MRKILDIIYCLELVTVSLVFFVGGVSAIMEGVCSIYLGQILDTQEFTHEIVFRSIGAFVYFYLCYKVIKSIIKILHNI